MSEAVVKLTTHEPRLTYYQLSNSLPPSPNTHPPTGIIMEVHLDYIEVVDQKVFAYHGVLQEEKDTGQDFYISFKAYLSMEEAAEKDQMNLSVSYADMCQTVKAVVQGEVYDLIETVADRTATALLLEYPLLDRVVLALKKPSAPVGEPVAYPAVTVDRSWHRAFVALGSNMGDSRQTLHDAIKQLGEYKAMTLIKVATIIETEPWGKTDQANFYNSVVELSTLLSPATLMSLLLNIEKDYGREREVKWGPRTLDLDLLLYDDLVTDDPNVTIPHPLMEERLFVLEPLCEIAPNVIHPVLRQRIFRLRDQLGKLRT